MQKGIIQIIEDCLKKHKTSPISINVPLTGQGNTSVSVYPQMLCLEKLIEYHPRSPEVIYAIAKYHKVKNDMKIDEEHSSADESLPYSVRSKIDELISEYFIKLSP